MLLASKPAAGPACTGCCCCWCIPVTLSAGVLRNPLVRSIPVFLTGLVISVVLGSGVPPVFMSLLWAGCTGPAAITGARNTDSTARRPVCILQQLLAPADSKRGSQLWLL